MRKIEIIMGIGGHDITFILQFDTEGKFMVTTEPKQTGPDEIITNIMTGYFGTNGDNLNIVVVKSYGIELFKPQLLSIVKSLIGSNI